MKYKITLTAPDDTKKEYEADYYEVVSPTPEEHDVILDKKVLLQVKSGVRKETDPLRFIASRITNEDDELVHYCDIEGNTSEPTNAPVNDEEPADADFDPEETDYFGVNNGIVTAPWPATVRVPKAEVVTKKNGSIVINATNGKATYMAVDKNADPVVFNLQDGSTYEASQS